MRLHCGGSANESMTWTFLSNSSYTAPSVCTHFPPLGAKLDTGEHAERALVACGVVGVVFVGAVIARCLAAKHVLLIDPVRGRVWVCAKKDLIPRGSTSTHTSKHLV